MQGHTRGFVLFQIPHHVIEKMLILDGPLSTQTGAEIYPVSGGIFHIPRVHDGWPRDWPGQAVGQRHGVAPRSLYCTLKFQLLVPCTPSCQPAAALASPNPDSTHPWLSCSFTSLSSISSTNFHWHLAFEMFLIKSVHTFKSYFAVSVLFRGQLLQNLISHSKYSSGRWVSGDALGMITALPGLSRGHLKGFFSPLNFVSFVFEMAFISVLVCYFLGTNPHSENGPWYFH